MGLVLFLKESIVGLGQYENGIRKNKWAAEAKGAEIKRQENNCRPNNLFFNGFYFRANKIKREALINGPK